MSDTFPSPPVFVTEVSDGFTKLGEPKGLDLTVEPLFSDADRKIARKRLGDNGYDFSRPLRKP